MTSFRFLHRYFRLHGGHLFPDGSFFQKIMPFEAKIYILLLIVAEFSAIIKKYIL